MLPNSISYLVAAQLPGGVTAIVIATVPMLSPSIALNLGSEKLSTDIKARRANAEAERIAIADRYLRRLNKKGNRLLLADKHPNKVKVACAREMVGFGWESPNRAAS